VRITGNTELLIATPVPILIKKSNFIENRLTLFYTVSSAADSLIQGSANIFCKGPNSKYFRLCGPRGKLEDI
jgi:hypothetical protein